MTPAPKGRSGLEPAVPPRMAGLLSVVVIVLVAVGATIVVRRSWESPAVPREMSGSVPVASPGDYYVSPAGSDRGDGRSPDRALHSIQRAVDGAGPGSTIHLAEGTYIQDVRSQRDGAPEAPIVITGPPTAVVKGTGRGRVVELNHDHHVLSGFSIDGLNGPPRRSSSYRNKLVLVQGRQGGPGVTGVRVVGMSVRNASGECIRLRNRAHGNEIADTRITGCGARDFRLGGGGKNGEAVYIGTAPEQLGGDGGGAPPDRSDGNRIHRNTIDTGGNECVDIKEGSSGNVVEYNSCTGQRDPESGGLDARGSGNVLRHNLVFANVGAGIRLGGDAEGDGTGNDVYDNTIRDNRGGGVKFMRVPQGLVCGNLMSGNGSGDAVGEFGDGFVPGRPCG